MTAPRGLRRYEYKYGHYAFPPGCEKQGYYLASDVDALLDGLVEKVEALPRYCYTLAVPDGRPELARASYREAPRTGEWLKRADVLALLGGEGRAAQLRESDDEAATQNSRGPSSRCRW